MRSRLPLVVLAAMVLASCETVTQAVSQLSASLQPRRATSTSHSQTGPASAKTANTAATQQNVAPQFMSIKWKPNLVDTASSAGYLNQTERKVIREINMVRTDPGEYARRFLVPLRSLYHGTLLQYPGEIEIQTNEGTKALDECISALESAQPVGPLHPKEGLFRAADDHVLDQGRTGAVGHSGSDGSTPESRVNRYGTWGISMGENVDYGNAEARRIVTSLLIDDGVPSRGHRKNLLNASFKFVGVAVGPHPTYRYMCVMDFAGSFK